VESAEPTGRLASEPPTRPISGAEPSAPTRAMRSGEPPGASGRGGEGSGAAASGRARDAETLVLGRYRLDRRLGAGGFGVVWSARDERLEREVAVKVIARAGEAGSRGVAERAFREARAAARLNHPGIVALYEMGADEEHVYLVSELVHGRTFGELARAHALSDRDVARIGAALAEALEHAHARGVIHRDVKPQNVIVVAEPSAGAGFAKLTDFGVAHLVGDDPLTRTGDVVGTLAYMAPEQAEGRDPAAASDVYALALTLFEVLAGENPARGRSPAETARLVGRRLPALRHYRRDLSGDLCTALDASLEPRPERRPALGDLRTALSEAIAELATEGGLVERETLARVGLLGDFEEGDAETRTAMPGGRAPDPRPEAPASLPGTAGARPPPSDHRGAPVERRPPGHRPAPDPWPEPRTPGPAPAAPAPLALRLAPRAFGGLAAGALTAAALALPAAQPPVAILPAAAGVAIATALLPRLAWLVTAAAVLAWIATGAGLDGAAAVALPALAATPVLLPRAGRAWSLPALAPLLGLAALAPAYVGVAGLARTPLRRAGLGAAGALWLAATEAIGGDRLLFGAPPAVPGPSAWIASLPAAVIDALPPFLTTPALAPALVWAAFACALPLAVRGRSLPLDLARGTLWAGGLIAAHAALAQALGLGAGTSAAPQMVAGSLLALAFAVAGIRVRRGVAEPLGPGADRPPAPAFDAAPVA
jgi:hypothetical protein